MVQETTKVEHTAGPWRFVVWNEGGSGEHIGVTSDSGDIASLQAHTEADARLISAAPDLLAALEKLTQSARGQHGAMGLTVNPIDVTVARAAIAKARGELVQS